MSEREPSVRKRRAKNNILADEKVRQAIIFAALEVDPENPLQRRYPNNGAVLEAAIPDLIRDLTPAQRQTFTTAVNSARTTFVRSFSPAMRPSKERLANHRIFAKAKILDPELTAQEAIRRIEQTRREQTSDQAQAFSREASRPPKPILAPGLPQQTDQSHIPVTSSFLDHILNPQSSAPTPIGTPTNTQTKSLSINIERY